MVSLKIGFKLNRCLSDENLLQWKIVRSTVSVVWQRSHVEGSSLFIRCRCVSFVYRILILDSISWSCLGKEVDELSVKKLSRGVSNRGLAWVFHSLFETSLMFVLMCTIFASRSRPVLWHGYVV